MQEVPVKYMDTYSVFVESGVATMEQVSLCMKNAISDAEKYLKIGNTCKFKVNLIVDKEGKYFGFGYIRVSDPRVYWMLLGKNPDGTERIEERLDDTWKMPANPNEGLSLEEILDKNKDKSWYDIGKEEDLYIQPKIKTVLPALINIPGFSYDRDQIIHLKELALENDSQVEIPKIGYFEISRAYATDPEQGMLKHRLCARNVPDWIPVEAFKAIFSFYLTESGGNDSKNDGKKKVTVRVGNREVTDTYPIVNFVDSKNGGRIVFITFDPNSHDAIFALLMTKKTHIINPKNSKQKVTLIFTHAFDNQKGRN